MSDPRRQKHRQVSLMTLDTFAKRLRFSRQAADLSQGELRDRMEREHQVAIGASYISTLESGADGPRPTLEVVRAMALGLGVSIDYLACLTDDPAPLHEVDDSPTYLTPEADQAAQLIDTMSQKHRALILDLARALADR